MHHVKIYKVPLSFFFVDSIEYRVEIKVSRKWSRLLSRGSIKWGLLTLFMREWWWREGEIDSNWFFFLWLAFSSDLKLSDACFEFNLYISWIFHENLVSSRFFTATVSRKTLDVLQKILIFQTKTTFTINSDVSKRKKSCKKWHVKKSRFSF